MDFLINFDNNTGRNLPSKLIDYSITNRPVLNITQEFSSEYLIAFLKGDYGKRMILPDIEQYHIIEWEFSVFQEYQASLIFLHKDTSMQEILHSRLLQ